MDAGGETAGAAPSPPHHQVTPRSSKGNVWLLFIIYKLMWIIVSMLIAQFPLSDMKVMEAFTVVKTSPHFTSLTSKLT